MLKIGYSIYTGLEDYPLEKNLEYLKLGKKYGLEFIFSSAHIPEATQAITELQTVINEADKLGMKLIVDVSKPMMDKFTMPEKLYSLRLDYGFTKEDVVELSKTCKCKIELNASTLSKEYIDTLVEMGLNTSNVRTSFNFYPKLYTGHDIRFVEEKIKLFKSYGFTVLAFIPSHYGFRPPMYEGLPSVESHRTMSTHLAIEELKALGVDEIAFGDAYVSEEELKTLSEHSCDELIINFNQHPEMPELFKDHLVGTFGIRSDYNDLMIRCTSKRGKVDVPSFNTTERNVYDVTIDNDGFARYKGEINIITKPLPMDPRVNVIGNVELSDVIVESLKRGRKFKFGTK